MNRSLPKRLVRSLCTLGLIVSLGGCAFWNSSKVKPADLGPNVVLLPVQKSWTAKIAPLGQLPLVVDVHGATLVLASLDGSLQALDANSGASLWQAKVGQPLTAGVGGNGRLQSVVTRSNEVVLLEQGREVWRKRLPAASYTPPLVAGGRVFVLTADRALTAFDAEDGRQLWVQQRTGESLVLRQAGVLTAVGDTLVAGLSGRLVGLNPDNGAVLWEAPLASPRGTNDVERLVDLVGPMHRDGSQLCARTFQATVACVDTASARAQWAQPARGAQGIGGDAERIVGTEGNGTVIAWRRADGSRLWSTDRLQLRKLSAPLLLGRSVVVGDDDGLVHLLSREDGSPLNRLTTDDSGIAAAPVVAADTLVVVTRNGGVYGFRPD
ncbi:outer membrane protein assembly factor BamB [Comamonas endophytica]|uniref:Outer membrane protein assembly factor BamB n=1 Tax=Comamonas endophytica TaxID=2949090 RepID=A0ABY6GB46_9BURK|nr:MULTISPECIES: outer membrane protein assembly factor BamB [unclassified Acidovorax]MCD2513704.1 outer membrane protein assembly factor BamB [Acidovorax sp. D4N7]UYG52289.1 outer membrane protein assembly factor BamB [Acidovorax sp. 5MLIR]